MSEVPLNSANHRVSVISGSFSCVLVSFSVMLPPIRVFTFSVLSLHQPETGSQMDIFQIACGSCWRAFVHCVLAEAPSPWVSFAHCLPPGFPPLPPPPSPWFKKKQKKPSKQGFCVQQRHPVLLSDAVRWAVAHSSSLHAAKIVFTVLD